MDHLIEIVVLAVSVFLLCIFVASATGLSDAAEKIPNLLANAIDRTTEDMNESQYTKYCSNNVTGSDVVTAVRRFKDSNVIVEVTIFTDMASEKTISTITELSGSFQNLPTSENYINPSAEFTGSVHRNQNDVIDRLIFKQNSFVSVAGISGSGSGTSVILAENENAAVSAENVPVVFSDEAEDATGNDVNDSEITQYLGKFENAIDNYSSRIDDVVQKMEVFSVEDGTSGELIDMKGQLAVMGDDIKHLRDECATSRLLSDDQKKPITDTLDAMETGIRNAISEISVLREKLSTYEDTTNSWCIGYPVSSDVRATLKDGTLTFSGTGKVAITSRLPKWAGKLREIKKVIFRNGVAPENIDYWFDGCINLSSVNCIPESVISANGTFNECRNLTGVIELKCRNLAGAASFRTCSSKPKNLKIKVSHGSLSEKTLKGYLARTDSYAGLTLEVVK